MACSAQSARLLPLARGVNLPNMALTEIETARVARIVGAFIDKRRPPLHVRHEVDLAFRINGQSVEIYEVRPRWRGAPGETMEHPVAKATYNNSRALWKIYWQRADLKWHTYTPAPSVGSIQKFVELVGEDKHACFFG
jgi:hypothetical protein